MVVDCSQNRTARHELFRLLKDKVHKMVGLELEENDHVLVLKDRSKVVARWSATGVTVEEIRDTTTAYIASSFGATELRLLRFWGRHPRAKLSLYTIAGALDSARSNLRHAITTLVEKGILKDQDSDNGLTTYTLTGDRQTQEYIDELLRSDWSEIDVLEKQVQGEAIAV